MSGGFLSDIERRQKILQEAMPRIRADITKEIQKHERRAMLDVLDQASDDDGNALLDAKTIGLKIPGHLRARLEVQAAQRGLGSYSRTVMVAIRFGLFVMEILPLPLRRKPRPVEAVEPEPEVVQDDQPDAESTEVARDSDSD